MCDFRKKKNKKITGYADFAGVKSGLGDRFYNVCFFFMFLIFF